jgi:translocation and assembly module TamB
MHFIRILKILKYFSFCVAFLLVMVLLGVNLPYSQRLITAKANEIFLRKDLPVHVERITLLINGDIGLRELRIISGMDTVIAVRHIKIAIRPLPLLLKKLIVRRISIDDALVNLKDDKATGKLNIISLFAPAQKSPNIKKKPGSWDIRVQRASLKKINFSYHSAFRGIQMKYAVDELYIRFSTFSLINKQLYADYLDLKNVKGSMVLKSVAKKDSEEKIPATWKFKLNESALKNIIFSLDRPEEKQRIEASLGKGNLLEVGFELAGKRISYGRIQLSNPVLALFAAAGDSKNKTHSNQETGGSFPGPWSISGSNLKIYKGAVHTYLYDGKSPLKEAYGLVQLTELTTSLKDLQLSSQASSFNMNRLSFMLENGFQLNKGRLVFGSDSTLNTTLKANLKTKHSRISIEIEARDELASIITKSFKAVPFSLTINKSEISLHDLFAFLPNLKEKLDLPKKEYLLELQGSVTGSTDLLKITDFRLYTPAGIGFFAGGQITNITNLQAAKCRMNFKTSAITHKQVEDLIRMTGKTADLPFFDPFVMQGRLDKSFFTPEITLGIQGASGNIELDGSADLPNKSYALDVAFSDLALGRLADIKDMDRVSGSIKLAGKNFIPDSIQAAVSVAIDKAGYKGYNYHNVTIAMKVDTGLYAFTILSYDTAARCEISGHFSQNNTITEGQFSGNLAMQPGKLNLYHDSIAISGELQALFSRTSAGMEASLDISNLLLHKGDKTVVLKRASFSVLSADSLLKATVVSDFLKADFQSHGSLADLQQAFGVHGIRGISMLDSAFNYRLPFISAIPVMDFSVEAAYSPLIGFFVPDSVFSFQKAVFALKKESNGNANVKLLTDRFNINKFKGFSTSLGLESFPDKTVFLLKADSMKVKNIALGASVIEMAIKERKADLRVTLHNNNDSVFYDIATELVKGNQQFELRSTQPQWTLNGNTWLVSPGNFLVLEPDTKDFVADLHVKNHQRTIDIYGRKSEKLQCDFREVLISMLILPGIIPYGFDAELNGKIDYRDNERRIVGIQMDFGQMKFSDKLLGNMNITGNYLSDTLGTIEADLHAIMNDTTRLMVTAKLGNDIPKIQTTFEKIPLHYIESFVNKYVSGLSGDVSGEVELTSPGLNHKLSGEVRFSNTEFKIVPLNAAFRLAEDEIKIANNRLLFDQFTLLDSLNKRLNVNGIIDMNNRANITADLQISSDNLQVMNTTEKDNPAFFGSVFINSKLNITGPVQKPSITGNLVLAGGTVINYRYTEDLTISETQKIITFASLKEDPSVLAEKRASVVALSKSPYMETSIEIDPKSIFNFQITRGFDIGVEITGGGFLNYAMLPNNTMSLNGTYEIQRGKSELKITGWPRKDFIISPGSYIRWNGVIDDPELRIETTSKVRGSYLNPVDNKNREVDFMVYMKLSNRLSQLDIVFDLLSQDQYIMSVVNSLSKEERMRQAINLLIFERIELPNMSSSSNYVTQQINQFWESQLNQLTKSTIKGVELSFGLNTYTGASEGGGEQEYTSLSYEVKKEMFHDRGSVMVSGKMNDNSPTSGQTNNMIENFIFEYALDTTHSKFLKVYRQQNYEDLLEGEVTKSGFGFIYRKSYDRLKDIWRRKKRQNHKPQTGSTK